MAEADGDNSLYDYADTEVWPAACNGDHQTPVDLPAWGGAATSKWVDTGAEGLTVDYAAFTTEQLKFYNTGHGVQVSAVDGSILGTATYGTKTYNALQYHIHFPSEHEVDGVSMAGELHIVHSEAHVAGDATTVLSDLLVVGVLFELGAHNTWLDSIGWSNMDGIAGAGTGKGDYCTIPEAHSVSNLVANGAVTDFYRYEGSLTTPPCTESVHWFVLNAKQTVSQDQVDIYNGLFKNTNRKVMALNDRVVYKNKVLLTCEESFADQDSKDACVAEGRMGADGLSHNEAAKAGGDDAEAAKGTCADADGKVLNDHKDQKACEAADGTWTAAKEEDATEVSSAIGLAVGAALGLLVL